MQGAGRSSALEWRRWSAAVQTLARADRRIAATVDQWDADPWLLNTPDGIVNLRDGTVRKSDPRAYMTKITGVGPRGNCPLFLEFLDRIMGGDKALVDYLQRDLRLLPHGGYQRASDLLQLRRRGKRQDRADVYCVGHPRRLLLRYAHRDVH